MQWLDSKKNFFPLINPLKYTMIFKNTLSQIMITFTILGMLIPTIPLDTNF